MILMTNPQFYISCIAIDICLGMLQKGYLKLSRIVVLDLDSELGTKLNNDKMITATLYRYVTVLLLLVFACYKYRAGEVCVVCTQSG